MRFTMVAVLSLWFLGSVAQKSSKLEMFAGYGYYEGFNLGTELRFGEQRHGIELSAGYDKNFYSQETFSVCLGYDHSVFEKRKNRADDYKWFLSGRAVLWHMEDNFYVWRAVTLIPLLSRRFLVSKKLYVSVDAGPAFNIVVYNKRKTFNEVGWPYHVMPNFRIICGF